MQPLAIGRHPWHWLRQRLLRDQALPLEPVSEVVDPMIRGNILLPHAEAVAALRIQVQFR